MLITYTAKRSIASGHAAGVPYAIETDAHEADDVFTTDGHTVNAQDGTAVSRLVTMTDGWSVTSDYIDLVDLDVWKEFRASIAAGESFTLDVYGTALASNNPQTVRLRDIKKPVRIRRASPLLFLASFEVVVMA